MLATFGRLGVKHYASGQRRAAHDLHQATVARSLFGQRVHGLAGHPLSGLVGHIDRLEIRGVAQAAKPVPAPGFDGPEPRCAEAGIGHENGTRITGQDVRQTFQELLLGLGRPLLAGRKHHVQDGQRATAHRYRRTQQMPTAIRLQIGPVDHDDGLFAAHQPARHGVVDVLALGMQMAIAQEAIQSLQGSAHALGVRPGACQVHQRQSPPVNRRLDSAQQHPTAQRMHRTECVAQARLQYFGSAHGVVSSGFVTREERPHHARTVPSISAQGVD